MTFLTFLIELFFNPPYNIFHTDISISGENVPNIILINSLSGSSYFTGNTPHILPFILAQPSNNF